MESNIPAAESGVSDLEAALAGSILNETAGRDFRFADSMKTGFVGRALPPAIGSAKRPADDRD